MPFVPFKAVTPTHDARGIGSSAKGHTRGPGNGDCHPRDAQKNARRALHDDTYRSIPRVARCQKGLGKSFEKQSYPGPTQIPNAADALGVDPSRSEPFAVPPPSVLLGRCLSPSPSCCSFDLILARIGCLPSSWWLLAPNTADCPLMKRGSSSGTARMLANCAPVTQPHSNMQPIDKASSESNLRESRRGLNVNAMTL